MIMTSIRDRIANVPGNFGVCYIDLKAGKRLFCGNCHVFPASGVVKMMVLIECFRQIEEERLDENATYKCKKVILPEMEGSSYGALQYLHDGVDLTLSDLYNLMITVSDNQAFNILVDIVGMDNINETFKLLGYQHMKINRKIFDMDKIKEGVENYFSVKEMADLFDRMYKSQLISPPASKKMLGLMEKHQQSRVIPSVLKDTIRIAHQSGFGEDVVVDGGIIYADEPFILTMAASQMDVREAEVMMRDITQICYEAAISEL